MGAIRVLRSPFSVSLGVHLALFAAWILWSQQRATDFPPLRGRPPVVWVEMERPKGKAHQKQAQRIVQTEPGQKVDQAAPDAQLGERTQTVDRQTVSSRREIQAGTAAAGKSTPVAAARPRGKVGAVDLGDLGVAFVPRGQGAQAREPDQPQWVTPGVGHEAAQDYVKGLAEGEKTALNTKEYVFFSYFQRIRSRLDLAWSKTLRQNLERFFRSGRRLASEMDHVTRTIVSLSPRGDVTRVQVLEESGTRDLDDAAVRAFNDAGPFPNPPHGLVAGQKEVQIRWDFILRN